jgi:hypothetical protein
VRGVLERVVLQRLDQHLRAEDVVPHRREREAGEVGHLAGVPRLLLEAEDAPVRTDLEDNVASPRDGTAAIVRSFLLLARRASG